MKYGKNSANADPYMNENNKKTITAENFPMGETLNLDSKGGSR
jgi:hypothetical protein